MIKMRCASCMAHNSEREAAQKSGFSFFCAVSVATLGGVDESIPMKKAVKGTCVFADKMRSKINQRLQNKQKRAKFRRNCRRYCAKKQLADGKRGLARRARRALLCAEISAFLALCKPYFSPFFSRLFHGAQENGKPCGIRLFLPIPIGAFSESFHAKNLTKPEVIC